MHKLRNKKMYYRNFKKNQITNSKQKDRHYNKKTRNC